MEQNGLVFVLLDVRVCTRVVGRVCVCARVWWDMCACVHACGGTCVRVCTRVVGRVCVCAAAVAAVQHVEAVLAQSELRQSGRGADGGLFRLVFPHHSAQQRPAQSLPQRRVADHVPLCPCQRAPPHHHAGLLV